MIEKTVPALIYDKLANLIEEDPLFKGISDELLLRLREKKKNEKQIECLLKKGKMAAMLIQEIT